MTDSELQHTISNIIDDLELLKLIVKELEERVNERTTK